MRTIEVEVPNVVIDALSEVADAAGLDVADLVIEGIRSLPAFQLALRSRPEFLMQTPLLSHVGAGHHTRASRPNSRETK